MCCLWLSEPCYIACIFNHSKGTPNVFSFVENTEGAWEICLLLIRDKQHIASSHNQGKNCQFNKLSPQAFGSILVQQVNQPHESAAAPMPLHSGKQHLPIFHLDISRKYGSYAHVLRHSLWAKDCCRQFRWLESHSKVFTWDEKSDLVWEILPFHLRDK